MPDGFATLRRGEKRPLYGQETATTGTLTIASTPVPSATLFDTNGVAVTGLAGVSVTGFDTGAQAAPRVWLNLDSTSVQPGFYTLVFTLTATGSDGLTRIYRPALEVQVTDVTA